MLWSFNPETEGCCGALNDLEEVETMLNAIPENWKMKLEVKELGCTHHSTLAAAIKLIKGFDVADHQ